MKEIAPDTSNVFLILQFATNDLILEQQLMAANEQIPSSKRTFLQLAVYSSPASTYLSTYCCPVDVRHFDKLASRLLSLVN